MILRTIVAALALTLVASAAPAQDIKAGKKVFKKCASCHFVDKSKNKIGPHLVGIVGRPAGTAEGYKYSKALKAQAEAGLVWTPEKLAEFLKKPADMVKGTKMTFAGLKKPDDITNVIAYLQAQTPE